MSVNKTQIVIPERGVYRDIAKSSAHFTEGSVLGMLVGRGTGDVSGEDYTFGLTFFDKTNKPPVIFAEGGVMKVGYVYEFEAVKFVGQITQTYFGIRPSQNKG